MAHATIRAGSVDEGRTLPGVWLVTLPFTTPLSLNDRMHHRVLAAHKKRWREASADAFLEAGIPACRRVRLTMFYVPRYNRRHDPDNLVLSMKPIADALVDAAIVTDDTAEFVERVWPVFLPSDSRREGGRILVQVEDLG